MPPDCVIGVDLGGTKLLAGAVDAQLGVHHRVVRPARGRDRAEVIERLVDTVQEAASGAPGRVVGVGFGIPSLMDAARGVAVFTNHLPLEDVPIATLMAERLGLPVAVDNDANCAMLAEHRFGAARGTRHAVLLTLGTGIGGGLVVDGRLVRGATGAAGEPGHMVVDLDGEPCPGNCPNRGCLETVVSGDALGRAAARAAREYPDSAVGRAVAAGREPTGALVTELAHGGDPVAAACLRTAGEGLGVGICNLVNLLNPEVVVVGGGMIAAGELLLEPARRVVRERALAPSRDAVRIVPARFGAESGMLGAAVLAMELAGVGAAT
jgi:glucokinase